MHKKKIQHDAKNQSQKLHAIESCGNRISSQRPNLIEYCRSEKKNFDLRVLGINLKRLSEIIECSSISTVS